jgi:hypothetical protein
VGKFVIGKLLAYIEFVELTQVMETKGLKILHNVKTRWISMLDPSIQVMNEYRTLLVKMLQDFQLKKEKAVVKNATTCLNHLIDVQIVLGLACIMPILKLANTLIKFVQANDAFVCDLLGGIQVLKHASTTK